MCLPMVKPLRLPFVSFLSLSLPFFGVLLVLLTRSARLSPVFAPPLLSRSLPFCATAGRASRERANTAIEKYFSFFTGGPPLIRVPATTLGHGFLLILVQGTLQDVIPC